MAFETHHCNAKQSPFNFTFQMPSHLNCDVDPNRLETIQELASGRFGVVREMRNLRTHVSYAVKFYHSTRTRGDLIAFKQSIPILISFHHLCVHPIISLTPPREGSGPMIAMEYLPNGSLADILFKIERNQTPEFWTHTQITIILIGILQGLTYLHSHGIVHAGLKPSDILLDENYRPKISDYATWTMERTGVIKPSQVGSPTYTAPEIYDCQVVPTESVDIFAFGLILYELIVGQKAFPLSLSTTAVMKRVILDQRPKIPETVDLRVRQIISQCWSVRLEDRPRASEVLEQFAAFDFKIFADVDRREIAAFVNDIQNT
jgi:serine/threonine protein kinase